MPVTFHMPGALREFAGGRTEIEIKYSPTNLADALSALWTLYPAVRDRMATEQGQIRPHINVFIGDENVRYTGGLATPVSAESHIWIVPAVSGGADIWPQQAPNNSCSLFCHACPKGSTLDTRGLRGVLADGGMGVWRGD